MKHLLMWLRQSSARIIVVVLLVALGFATLTSYQKTRDLRRVCALLGSHDTVAGEDITAERRAIDVICLGQETDDEW